MFGFCGFAAIIGIERGALDPPMERRFATADRKKPAVSNRRSLRHCLATRERILHAR
jgi:hypothetical protein